MTEKNYSKESKKSFEKPSKDHLKASLSPLQYAVTQEDATEPPFANEYWDNKQHGLYVDIISGEPLFTSMDKYDSGCGWPSFTKPVAIEAITTKPDHSLNRIRTEVRSADANIHLGHVFDDGPGPDGKRYCINSASLRFIPLDQLADAGYGDWRSLFEDRK